MSRRLVAALVVAAVAVGACTRKRDTAAETAAPGTAPAAAARAPDGAPGSASPAAGQGHNTGTPVDGDATVKAPAAAVGGAAIEVSWTGPGNTGDYIDLAPRGRGDAGGEMGYTYTREAIPVARLRAPTAAGDYDIRYIVDLGSAKKVKAVTPISISAATATVAAPARAEGAEPLKVTWTGPSGDGDYVDIVPAGATAPSGEITSVYTRDGNPALLTAPGRAGAYQVRYVLEGPGGRKVLATSPLAVTQSAATLDAVESVAAGTAFPVTWTGPRRKGDYVDLVKRGNTQPSGEVTYFYTDRTTSNELTAPKEAGAYDLRYVLEAPGGRVVLATRPITVR